MTSFRFSSSPIQSPCKDCQRRRYGCRSRCYDWIDYEQKKEAEYEKKRIIYLGEKRSK